MLDGCHGTTGLTESSRASGISAVANNPGEPVLQFFSASSDDEYAMESSELGGGAFTQALIRVLDRGLRDGHGLWMRDIVANTGALIRAQPNVRQTPKLVTVSGEGEVYWSPVRQTR